MATFWNSWPVTRQGQRLWRPLPVGIPSNSRTENLATDTPRKACDPAAQAAGSPRRYLGTKASPTRPESTAPLRALQHLTAKIAMLLHSKPRLPSTFFVPAAFKEPMGAGANRPTTARSPCTSGITLDMDAGLRHQVEAVRDEGVVLKISRPEVHSEESCSPSIDTLISWYTGPRVRPSGRRAKPVISGASVYRSPKTSGRKLF